MKKFFFTLFFLLPLQSYAVDCSKWGGPLYVSSYNTFLDNTAAAAAGCVIKLDPSVPGNPKVGDPVGGGASTLPKGSSTVPAAVPSGASSTCVNVPTGWSTSGTGSSCTLVPPSTATPTPTYTSNSGTYPARSTGQAACQDVLTEWQKTHNATYYPSVTYNSSNNTCHSTLTLDGSDQIVGGVNVGSSCPSGYIGGSGTCTLSNASQVAKPSDGVCTINRSGNSYTADTTDPDCSGTTNPTAGSPVSDKSPQGEQKVQANSDGSTVITYNTYNYTDNTTTIVTINVGSDGKVSGVSTSKTVGIGTANTGQTANTTPTNGATSADIAGLGTKVDGLGTKLDGIKSGQCGGTGQPACKTDETGTPSSYNDGGKTAALNSKFDELTDKVTNQNNGVGQGLQLPNVFGSVGCANPSFNNQVIDVCGEAVAVQPYGKFAAYILTLYGIWGLWFRRMGGTT